MPTWSYAVVHVSGPLIFHDEEKWVKGQVGMLTKRHETSQPAPWKMADAPLDYLDTMLANIVGIEIPITRMTGKVKANQNRGDVDRLGAIAGLRDTADPYNAAMAAIMAECLDGDRGQGR